MDSSASQPYLNNDAPKVAYFCMEYAIHQSLKIYSGGLGFLAGSHLRSAFALKKNLIGIGILWKSGYYDQVRQEDQTMKPVFLKKEYSFLEDTGIRFFIQVNHAPVLVKAMFLPPAVFGSAPLYLLSTDLPENDFLARSIVDRLYAPNDAAKIAQSILLGIGGGMLLEKLKIVPDVYHLNEGHGLPLAFYLYRNYKNLEEVKKRLVFTTHTPERAGNEEHPYSLLDKMGFFAGVSVEEVKNIAGTGADQLNYTVAALKLSKIANGVSQIHGKVSKQLWGEHKGICNIVSITNAQNQTYWQDSILQASLREGDDQKLIERKTALKMQLFDVVSDQTGKLFDPQVLTIVWARRFAGYKRADLLLRDFDRFVQRINDSSQPIQVIWAGKPYPEDHAGIDQFNGIFHATSSLKRCAVLTGYELNLSSLLKKGSDVWLNTPRYPREASGTSGMSAAMNATVNLSVADGWFPEFVRHGNNGFSIPVQDSKEYFEKQDEVDHGNLFSILESEILPLYYQNKEKWLGIMKNSMRDVYPRFDSDRMVNEYFETLYQQEAIPT